jgi:hypothetical protein
MKTAELIGLPLNWAVVKCECAIPAAFKSIPALLNGSVRVFRGDISSYSEPVSPSTNWAHGGPIIEREEISISREFAASKVEWAAWTPAPIRDDAEAFGYGPTPLIAAMRCYVASKLGDEVEIPKGLK